MSRLYFHADEILSMAQQIERNGASFYRKASEIASLSEIRQRLLGLAAMEDEHEKIFAAMEGRLSEKEREAAASRDPDAALYVRSWADAHVFDVNADPAQRLTGVETKADILRMALEMEKDSIAFYVGVRALVPEGWGQERLDAIIKEEMRHIVDLRGELSSLNLT